MREKSDGVPITWILVFIVIFGVIPLVFVIMFVVSSRMTPPTPIPMTCSYDNVYFIVPTAEDPICMRSELNIRPGGSFKDYVSFYNREDADIPSTIMSSIECVPSLNLGLVSNPVEIPIDESRDFNLIIEIEPSAALGNYACNFTLSRTSVPFTITIENNPPEPVYYFPEK